MGPHKRCVRLHGMKADATACFIFIGRWRCSMAASSACATARQAAGNRIHHRRFTRHVPGWAPTLSPQRSSGRWAHRGSECLDRVPLGRGHYDRLPRLTYGFVDRKVAVIAAVGGPTIALAARAATTTIPIVFQIGVDPVELGLVTESGTTRGKHHRHNVNECGVGREARGAYAHAGTRRDRHSTPRQSHEEFRTNAENDTQEAQAAANKIGVQLQVLQASAEDDFGNVFAKILDLRVGGLLLGTNALFTNKQLLDFSNSQFAAHDQRAYRSSAEAGGLMSYGGDIANSWRLAGVYTGRVLGGKKPPIFPYNKPPRFNSSSI